MFIPFCQDQLVIFQTDFNNIEKTAHLTYAIAYPARKLLIRCRIGILICRTFCQNKIL